MKKALLVVGIIASFAADGWAASAVTTGNMLKLRKKPKLTSVAIEAYPKGEKVKILDRNEIGNWVKVRVLSDGKEGYMAAKYVSADETADFGEEKVSNEISATGFGGVIPQNDGMNGSKDFQIKEEKAEVPEKAAKVIALAPAADEPLNLTGLKAEYDAVVNELSSARQEIQALKHELAGVKNLLSTKENEVIEMKQIISRYDRITDIRLMGMLEAMGEEVMFTGIGLVRIFEEKGRVIIRVPGEYISKATKYFARVANKNTFGSDEQLYITLDKNLLIFGKG